MLEIAFSNVRIFPLTLITANSHTRSEIEVVFLMLELAALQLCKYSRCFDVATVHLHQNIVREFSNFIYATKSLMLIANCKYFAFILRNTKELSPRIPE